MQSFYSWMIKMRVDTDWKKVKRKAIITIVVLLVLNVLLVFGINSCMAHMYRQRLPMEGVWYCEQLQAQFTYRTIDGYLAPEDIPPVDENENYVIVNGDRIAALIGHNHGSDYVTIICQEFNHPEYAVGESIYAFTSVSYSDTAFVLKDDAGQQYTFLRIADTPPNES